MSETGSLAAGQVLAHSQVEGQPLRGGKLPLERKFGSISQVELCFSDCEPACRPISSINKMPLRLAVRRRERKEAVACFSANHNFG